MHRSLCSSRSHGPGDNAAGHLDLKIRERKARNSPPQYDMTLVAELRRPSSADAIKIAIDRMIAQGQISEESKQRIRESGDYLPSCRCAVGCRVRRAKLLMPRALLETL